MPVIEFYSKKRPSQNVNAFESMGEREREREREEGEVETSMPGLDTFSFMFLLYFCIAFFFSTLLKVCSFLFCCAFVVIGGVFRFVIKCFRWKSNMHLRCFVVGREVSRKKQNRINFYFFRVQFLSFFLSFFIFLSEFYITGI